MKRYTTILLLLLCTLAGRAQQDFTQLDWNELRLDSVLPHYTEVVPLETDYRLYTYYARVRYPEWGRLTAREEAVADRFADQIADTLCLHTFVGISRGEGLIDIDFVPLIRRDGHYWKLLSGKIEIVPVWKGEAAEISRISRIPRDPRTSRDPRAPRDPRTPRSSRNPSSANQVSSDTPSPRWADHSVLASGKWARITLTDDGIYHLTNSQLRSLGFSNTTDIRVYGYGGHQQPELIQADTDWDDLEAVSLLPVADGYLFHANGLTSWNGRSHVQNHYARTASYFVTDGGSAVPTFPQLSPEAEADAEEVTTFVAGVAYDPQQYAWYQGGWQLYENYDYASGNAQNYSLTLPAYPTDGDARLKVRFSAFNTTETQVSVTLNGSALGTFSVPRKATEYDYAKEENKTFNVATPLTKSTVRLTTTSGQHARLNYLELTYTALLRIDAQQPWVQFTHTNSGEAEALCLEYANGQTPELWRLGERGVPTARLSTTEQTTADGRHLLLAPIEADGQQHRYVALDTKAYASYPKPTSAGAVANQDLHATDSLDLVILTPASGIFDQQAERLAALHRDLDGLRVGVFRADQVYNEFSSGTPDATAYRRFLKMLYDRGLADGTAPRYLLLFGDCAWDNRMLTSSWRTYNPDDFLLCYESENSYNDISCYVMEDYFGLLDDGEGVNLLREKTDLGIGRLPVRTQKEATAFVNKLSKYMLHEEAGAWRNVLCFMGDDGDNNSHERMADEAANLVANAHPEMEVRKVIWDAYTRQGTSSGYRYPEVAQLLKKQMEEGALMMNYTGHAAIYTLSHEQVLRVEDFPTFTAPRPPLWVTAACDVMPFDTQKENIGESAVLNETGAAIAFYGTTRTVYASENSPTNKAFCTALFRTPTDGVPVRLGDAARECKVTIINAGQYTTNKLHYALLGDPALRLGSLPNRVVVDSINSTAVADLPSDFTLHAGGVCSVAGHLADLGGTTLDDFQGTLTLRLYDSESTITCNQYDREASGPFTYRAYDRQLCTGQDSIRGGRFSIACPIPLDIKYSDAPGRLLFYALSADRQREANGYCHAFRLGGTEATKAGLTDTEGPRIVATLGGDDFVDGDVVGATPYFVAELEDESGISVSGNGVGHDLELIVDNDPTTTYNLNSYFTGNFGDYRRGTVAFSLPSLSAGTHSLVFRAWDTLNNPSSQTITFTVDPSKSMSLTQLTASPTPARTETQFLLTYDRPGSSCQFTIEVFDFTGRVLWSHTTTGSSSGGLYAIPWNLVTNAGAPVGSGIYLYRARVSCDESEEVTQTHKLIVNRSF